MSSHVKMQLVAFYALLRREIYRVFRIWPQSLLPSVITSTLYFLIFGHVIGERIGTMEGLTYMQFIAPGLVMLASLTNSYSNVSFSFYITKFDKSVENLLVAPISAFSIVMAYVFGGVIRGVFISCLVTLITWLFTGLWPNNIYFCLLVILLATTLVATGGFINGMFANKPDDASIVPIFILAPLTYLGGVFYSITLLAPIWQQVSKFNPILYIVNLLRYGFYGVAHIPIYESLMVLLSLDVVFIATAVWLVVKGVRLKP